MKRCYVRRKLNNGGYEYICAPTGYRWTESGITKEAHSKGGPEMSEDPYKKHFFKSERGAKIESNRVPGSSVVFS